ncbi:hypothetical protein V8G54_005227 [Vigna mungo]|uniref:Uncharacterized protein n=1 Tax=Vigna mungo TaxID=3915 RepID=A0AAQ3PE04_VIGMU
MAASTSLSKVSTRCWSSLMERAWSAVREALEKVSSSTKTALVRRSFWRDSRFDDISVRFVIAPLHRSPFSFSPVIVIISLPSTNPPLSLINFLLLFSFMKNDTVSTLFDTTHSICHFVNYFLIC